MTVEKALPALPEWLQTLLPEPSEPQTLSVNEHGKLVLTQPDGTTQSFSELKHAYEATRESEFDLQITSEVYSVFGKGPDFPFLGFKEDDKSGFSVMMISYTDEDRIENLKRGYQTFLEAADAYAEEPQSFYNSYRFVDLHPAFWLAQNPERDSFSWTQEGHSNRLRLSVYRGTPTASVRVSLETGSHVEPEYTSHYGDWRLEISAPTYELAMVKLAERVSLTHNLDGTDIENSDELFEKPRWVKELEERLEETAVEL